MMVDNDDYDDDDDRMLYGTESTKRTESKHKQALYSVAELMSGIVQGSGLGPLLFLVYINDKIKKN